MLNGIDISSWQGDIDLSAYPLDFVIVKATQGTWYVNPWCDKKVQEAKELGLLWGFYHFAEGTGSATEEADYFIDNCIGYFNEGIPVLDFEADALTAGEDWAKSFLSRVYERTGIRAIIYMSQSVTKRFGWSDVAKEHGLWVALYPNVTAPDFSYAPEFPATTGAWEYPAIWQYASDGFGNLDVNHAYMTREAWGKYAGWEESESEQIEQESEAITIEDDKYKVTIERKG